MRETTALIAVFYNPFQALKDVTGKTVNNIIYYFVPIIISACMFYNFYLSYETMAKQAFIVKLSFITITAMLWGSLIMHWVSQLIKFFIKLAEKENVEYRKIKTALIYASMNLIVVAVLGLLIHNTDGILNAILIIVKMLALIWYAGIAGIGVTKASNLDTIAGIVYGSIPALLFALPAIYTIF